MDGQEPQIPGRDAREWEEWVERWLENRFAGIEERASHSFKGVIISFLVGLAAGIVAHPIGYWLVLMLFGAD